MPGKSSDWEVHEGGPRKQGAGPSTVLRISGVKGTGRIVYQLAPDDDTLWIDRIGDPTDNVRPTWHEHEAALAELWRVHRERYPD